MLHINKFIYIKCYLNTLIPVTSYTTALLDLIQTFTNSYGRNNFRVLAFFRFIHNNWSKMCKLLHTYHMRPRSQVRFKQWDKVTRTKLPIFLNFVKIPLKKYFTTDHGQKLMSHFICRGEVRGDDIKECARTGWGVGGTQETGVLGQTDKRKNNQG